MSITLSDKAVARVKQFLQRADGVGLRFGVRRTGCSGWAYDVGIADAVHDDDHHFRCGDIDIYVDDKSLAMVDGTHIDFAQQGLNQSFVFDNPNVKAECGCGESFTTTEMQPSPAAMAPANPF
jgi:iron-sulfur cluster assembly protein